MNISRLLAIIGLISYSIFSYVSFFYLFVLPLYNKARTPDKFLTPLVSNSSERTVIAGAKAPENIGSPIGSVLAAAPKKEVVGFLPFWLLNEEKNIPYDKLTQIAYFGLEVDETGQFVKVLEDQTAEPGFHKMSSDNFSSLKFHAREHNIKLLLTLRLMHTRPIEALLNNPSAQNLLIDNTLYTLKTEGFQGVNIDFEYDGTPPDKTIKNFTKFAKELTDKVHAEIKDGTVSVSAYADSAYKTRITEIWPLSQVTDHIIIMGYDFFRPSSETAGPVSPLCGSGNKFEYDLTKTVTDYCKLASSDKVILGLPFYGYDWPVIDEKPYGFPLESAAMSSYSRTVKLLAEKGLTAKWEELSQTPYITYQDEETGMFRQIYFDNPKSLNLKLNLIKEHSLAGVAIWALGYEGENKDLWEVIGNSLNIP